MVFVCSCQSRAEEAGGEAEEEEEEAEEAEEEASFSGFSPDLLVLLCNRSAASMLTAPLPTFKLSTKTQH